MFILIHILRVGNFWPWVTFGPVSPTFLYKLFTIGWNYELLTWREKNSPCFHFIFVHVHVVVVGHLLKTYMDNNNNKNELIQ
jgi:hypothetical protein